MRPPIHNSRGLGGLCSFRDDAPIPQETGGQVGWGGGGGVGGWGGGGGGGGHPRGDRGLGRRYGMWNSRRVDGEGDKIWSVKK